MKQFRLFTSLAAMLFVAAFSANVHAMTFNERVQAVADSFKSGPQQTIGSNVILVYAYALPMGGGYTGSSRAGSITSLAQWGIFTVDGGLLSGDLTAPSQANGSPLLGGSVHIDQFISLAFPELASMVKGYIPGTADKLMYSFQIGAGVAHDFTAERTLPTVYAGPKIVF